MHIHFRLCYILANVPLLASGYLLSTVLWLEVKDHKQITVKDKRVMITQIGTQETYNWNKMTDNNSRGQSTDTYMKTKTLMYAFIECSSIKIR